MMKMEKKIKEGILMSDARSMNKLKIKEWEICKHCKYENDAYSDSPYCKFCKILITGFEPKSEDKKDDLEDYSYADTDAACYGLWR